MVSDRRVPSTPEMPKSNPQKYIYVILSILILISGCRREDDTPDEISPFEIIVISDIHVRIPGNPDDGYYDNRRNIADLMLTVDLINEKYSDADFVAVTGDLVGCLFSEDPYDYPGEGDNPPAAFKKLFDHLTLPYYVALGNHDYFVGFDPMTYEHIPAQDPEAVETVWKMVLDIEPYYSFIHKGIQMIFLNSNRGPSMFVTCSWSERETLCLGSFDSEQMEWLESCLNRPEPAIIFCHHPPGKDIDPADSFSFTSFLNQSMTIDRGDRFYEIAESHRCKILAMFVGHMHQRQEYTLFDSIKVYQTGSVGDFSGSGENISIVEINPVLKTINVVRHPKTDQS